MVTGSFVCLLTQIDDNTSSWKVFSWCFCQSGLTMATPLLLKVSRFKSSYFPYCVTKPPPPPLLPKFGVTVTAGYLSWTSAGLLSGSRDFKTGLEIVLLHLRTDDHGVVGWWLWTLFSSSFFNINLKGVYKTHTVGRRSKCRCGKSSHSQGRGRYRPAISGASCCRVPLISGAARKIKYKILLQIRVAVNL